MTLTFEYKTQRTLYSATEHTTGSQKTYFDNASQTLFQQAVIDYIKVINEGGGNTIGKLTLVGILDTKTGQAAIYPTKPRKCNLGTSFLFEMSEYPQITSNDPTLGKSGMWTMRLKSHHKRGRGFNGPVSHIHALHHFNGTEVLSSDDSLNRIGFSIFIEYNNGTNTLIADGKSRSLNHDAQLLRIKYSSGYELTEEEASEKHLYSGTDNFNDYAEDVHMLGILDVCAAQIQKLGKSGIAVTNTNYTPNHY